MNIEFKKQYIESSKNYTDYVQAIDLKNRFKSQLSAQEKKELSRLNNLRLKYDKLYFGFSV